jgi:glyoxylase-like metal-dependent hydrolase (beta-lactamase superfamily II)
MPTPPWFKVQQLPHSVTLIGEPHHRENVKAYLGEGSRDVAVLDTGLGVGDFAGLVASLSPRPPLVLQTHAHWDHIGASHRFDRVLIHPAEADALRHGWPAERYQQAFTAEAVDARYLPPGFDPAAGIPGCEPTGVLKHGDRVDLGDRVLEVIHTPGHSPGGLTFLDRQARVLFPGDLLYLGRMFVFFPHSDPAAFRASLQQLVTLLDGVETVYPAHNASPLLSEDVSAIHEAYEAVWAGRAADARTTLFGLEAVVYTFDRFSFLLRPAT